MASFRFELNGRPTRNKKYVVYLRVTIGGKRKLIKTNVEINRPSDFNSKCKGENWVRSVDPDATVKNEYLSKILANAKETYKDLELSDKTSVASLAKELNREKKSPSFLAFARERTQMIYDSGGWRNWRRYCGFINKLDAFRKKRKMSDITMDDLTVDLLTKFDNFLHKWENAKVPGKMLHPNTIEVQFNIFRALIHKAIELQILEASKDPFLVFKYSGVATSKEKLTEVEIQRIVALELEEGSLIWHCKNYFLFSYYCAGIRAGDLIQLRWRNISEDGRVRYQMGKNHKVRDLILVPQAKEILQHYYVENVNPNDYIFPLLDNEAPYAQFITQAHKDSMPPELRDKLYQQVSSKNAIINKYLKKIADKAEISITLTMHISRHSFAHIAQESGAESGAIKNILGHSNLATTERYMGSFDTSKTDETLRSIFQPQAEPKQVEQEKSTEEQARELLQSMTPEQILSLFATLKK